MRRRSRQHIRTISSVVALLSVFVGTLPVLAQAPTGRSFVWKATGRQTAIYLVGSVHLLSKDYYPLNPTLDQAFKDTDLLVEELDLGEMAEPTAQMRMLTRGMLPAGQTLDKVVAPDTYEMVKVRAAALGLPFEPLRQFKPWSLSLMLMSLEWNNAGFGADLGLDKYFYDKARADGRLIQGLETPEYQISRLDEMSAEQQDRFLAGTLKDLETGPQSVEDLAKAWKAGDAAAIQRLAIDDLMKEKELYQRMILDRNRNWLPKIEALFNRRGRALVVVGAAHLVGPDGLLEMLTAKGYTIEQL